ncbi:MAG TPA: 30S ribosomal protein S9, partial [Candidatus Colwellbacteria bacterium]|nr:30S ribosomal protein S9 [Candidatus Colwellbacteria bacterium]
MAKDSKKEGKYFEAVGRRKTAVARVRIMPGETGFTV